MMMPSFIDRIGQDRTGRQEEGKEGESGLGFAKTL